MHNTSGLPKIISVVGATASGKTALGLAICQHFSGEIVSADAKQVYRGMDLGTAKEQNLPVKQHLIDILDPGQKITVAAYQALAYPIIDQLLLDGCLPVLVGGSGLYAEAVINGYQFLVEGKSTKSQPHYQVLKLAIFVPRDELKERALLRLRQRVEAGLPAEVEGLLAAGVPAEWLRGCGLEYRYFTDLAEGIITEEEAIAQTATATYQFIKRQYTWWRRHPDVHFVHSEDEAITLVEAFLHPQ